MKTVIIAEAGVNHNGDMDIAKRLIDEAKKAGADYVKFQTAVDCTSKYAPKAEYQKRETGADETQLQMALKLRLKLEQHRELYEYCAKKGIKHLILIVSVFWILCNCQFGKSHQGKSPTFLI